MWGVFTLLSVWRMGVPGVLWVLTGLTPPGLTAFPCVVPLSSLGLILLFLLETNMFSLLLLSSGISTRPYSRELFLTLGT